MTRALIFSFCCLLAICQLPAARGEISWKFSAGKVDITPEENLWMAGYSARKSAAEGVLQKIHAKALALEDEEGNRFAIITWDLIGVPKGIRVEIEKIAEKECSVPPAYLVINASHTHCGPMLRLYQPPGSDEWKPSYSNVPEEESEERVRQTLEYREKLIGSVREMLKTAFDSLEPGNLQWSHARCGFAMNRRTPAGPGQWKNYPNPEGPVDHEVPVLQVLDADKELKAVLFGYACHATTLSIMQFNGDWPGYAQQFFEESHPGVIAMFVNGASADQNPYPRRLLPYVERHGRAMTTAIEAALEVAPRPVTGPLRAAIDWVDIKYQTPPTREQLETKAQSKDKYDARHAQFLLDVLNSGQELPVSYPIPVQVVRFGDSLTMLTMGGEVVVDYAHRLKKEIGQKSGGAPVWFAGYSNDVMTYVPSLRVLEEGGYEGGMAMRYVRSTIHPAHWEPTIEEKLVGRVHELFEKAKE